MTEEERRKAIENHRQHLARTIDNAEADLADITNGTITLHAQRDGGPMQDVTAARATHLRGLIKSSKDILAAYDDWDA